ncbi:MAG: hypothetical protein GY841_10205 [FCB group bacterium]|nr:hypothetical protein [FCB group bacterium]
MKLKEIAIVILALLVVLTIGVVIYGQNRRANADVVCQMLGFEYSFFSNGDAHCIDEGDAVLLGDFTGK